MLERNMSSPLQDCMGHPVGLLRDMQNGGYPYLFQDWLSAKPLQQYIQKSHKEYETFARDEPFVALKRWLTRSDFHHPLQGSATSTREREYFTVLPQTRLTLDLLPIAVSQFGC